MTAKFDKLRAIRLCNELASELAKLDEVPRRIMESGDVLSMTKFCLPGLVRCFESGVFDGLVPGAERPVWLKD
jgi:hypothetical protein